MALFGCCIIGGAAVAKDWPQWHGPDRRNLAPESGLLKDWKSGPPRTLWSISGIGRGYGSVSIVGDRIYVQGTEDGRSAVFCLGRADG
jgi:hypothetical protein